MKKINSDKVLARLFISFAILVGFYAFFRMMSGGVLELFAKNGEKAGGLLVFRWIIYLGISAFACLHIWLKPSDIYHFLYRYRLAAALVLLLFLTLFKIHNSSVVLYDAFIQPGEGSGYSEALFGRGRWIRSDEWLVTTPRLLSTKFAGIGPKNTIPMAQETDNLAASGIELSWASWATPLYWGYYSGNVEIGLAFCWNFLWIFTLLVSFEMGMLISGNHKKIALAGACMFTFSSFFTWWSGISWMLYGQAAIVSIHYAITAEKKWTRILFGMATAISGSAFAVVLYPAWQVPSGYMFLVILICILWRSREKIKSFDIKDWGIVIVSIVFMASILLSYLYEYRSYIEAISHTVYPGARIGVGGFSLDKLAGYIGGWFFPFREMANPCEAGVVFNLFPLPMIVGVIYMIKNKKWDGLIGGLVLLSVLYTIYCSTEIPVWLAKVTLMSNSTSARAVDVLAIVQLYLLIAVAGKADQCKLNIWVAAFLTIAVSIEAAITFNRMFPDYLSRFELMSIVILITLCIVPWIAKGVFHYSLNISVAILCVVTVASGMAVHPISKGLDVIYSKPVAKEIMEIVKDHPKDKWLALNGHTPCGFTIACGAPTINSVNFIPNYELWEKLDPEKNYEDIWNRYAHMQVELIQGETSVELIQADLLVLYLDVEDLKEMDVKYIFSLTEINSTETVSFEPVYAEAGCYIYEVL